jgi:teichuronic acid biosynthesis glycosyltransferase TuaH
MDFIFVGLLEDWNLNIGSNAKNIALQLSLHHRVLYVNKPLDRKTLSKENKDDLILKHIELVKKKQDSLFEAQHNLWYYYPPTTLESINWVPSDMLFSILNKSNSKKLAADIKLAADRLGFKDYIIFNDNEMFRAFYLKEFLKPKLYIYYSRDNLLGVPYWKKHGTSIEPKHIAKSDIALANSIYLSNYCKRYNPNSYYIGQGCNISQFDYSATYEKPDDIKNIKGPIIGYVGAIVALRIDMKIIEVIARARPDWSIVLVGPEDETFTKSNLHELINVYFLGKKKLDSVPSYLSSFDVCINPQLLNEVTIGNYPLKVDEYLAMGKPTVITKTEAAATFEDCVYIANRPEDYPILIEQALKEDSKELQQKRVKMAKSHSWENSVEKMYQVIDKIVSH